MNTNAPKDWEKEFADVIHPLLNRAVFEYSRYIDTSVSADLDIHNLLVNGGKALVIDNKTYDLRQSLKAFISKVEHDAIRRTEETVLKSIDITRLNLLNAAPHDNVSQSLYRVADTMARKIKENLVDSLHPEEPTNS